MRKAKEVYLVKAIFGPFVYDLGIYSSEKKCLAVKTLFEKNVGLVDMIRIAGHTVNFIHMVPTSTFSSCEIVRYILDDNNFKNTK